MLELFELQGKGAMLIFLPPSVNRHQRFVGIVISREELIKEYYCNKVPNVLTANKFA